MWQTNPPDFEADGVSVFEQRYYWAVWDKAFPENAQVVEVNSDGEDPTTYTVTWDGINYSNRPESWHAWWSIPLTAPPPWEPDLAK